MSLTRHSVFSSLFILSLFRSGCFSSDLAYGLPTLSSPVFSSSFQFFIPVLEFPVLELPLDYFPKILVFCCCLFFVVEIGSPICFLEHSEPLNVYV